MPGSALALANNDVVQIVWRTDAKITGCLGFAVFRKQKAKAFAGLRPDDGWQDKYFDPANPASHDADVWFGAGARGPA